MIKLGLALGFGAGLLTGCVTDKAKTDSKEAARASAAQGPTAAAAPAAAAEPGVPPPGIGFVYRLDHGAATPPMHNCYLHFAKDDGHTTVETHLVPEANRILVKVPAGSYTLVDAKCDNGRQFSLPRMPTIPVAADSVTFLGEVRLVQAMAGKRLEKDTLELDHGVKEESTETYGDFQKRGLKLLWWKPAK